MISRVIVYLVSLLETLEAPTSGWYVSDFYFSVDIY